MQQFEKYKDIPSAAQGCVIAIGNFDGVHKGHQVLINRAKTIAKAENKKLAVLTFEPHPRALFRSDEAPFRITPAPLKAHRLEKLGIDYLFSIPFNWDFASQSAENFVNEILIKGLGAFHVVVGYDFRFGQLRKGEPETIKAAGIPVTVVAEVADEDESALSSSRVRTHLRHGELDKANKILGWDWEIWGSVIKGDQRGRKIGYPTANMDLEGALHPSYGVYATLAHIGTSEKATWLPAATNIGIRPMFEVPTAQVETYIFDFDQEIYGEVLRVRPVARLRGEAKFDNLDDLIAQIKEDCAQAKDVLGATTITLS